MEPFASRRERLVRQLAEESIDGCLVTSPVNVSYLTGFSGESSVLVVAPRRVALVSDSRFTEQLAEECPGLEVYIRPTAQKLSAAVAEVAGGLGCRSLGFESAAMTVAEREALGELLPAVNWRGASDRVERLRLIKDHFELAQIRQAIAIAERAYTVLTTLLAPDDTERHLCDAMESYVRQAGGKTTSFPTIIASGPRAALPHAPPTDRRVGDGELLLVDWGASGPFYKSDLTRVLDTRRRGASSGPDGKLEEIYGIVRRAQERAIAAVRPGAKAGDVDTAARQTITDAGHATHFGHGLGHGIGLQVHEAPAVRPGSETTLAPGMVFTVEPGIYLPGWGGVRIEDDVLVTPDGCEVLTHANRDLVSAFAGR